MGHSKDLTLEEEMAEMAAYEMQKEIDSEIMRSFLVEGGWTEIEFYFKNNDHAIDILLWCEWNIKKDQWKRLGGYFVFRKKQDAEWFVLKWL